jgi:hypothetical protein
VDAGVDHAAPTSTRTDAAAPTDAPYLTGTDRQTHIVNTVMGHQDVAGCWTDALEQNSDHAPEHFTLHVSVDASGVAQSVDFDGINDTDLAHCVDLRVRGHRFGPGDAMRVDMDFNLAP